MVYDIMYGIHYVWYMVLYMLYIMYGMWYYIWYTLCMAYVLYGVCYVTIGDESGVRSPLSHTGLVPLDRLLICFSL